jgi:hypothetical protein
MVDDFRDKPVKVGVSLAMGIIRKIDRNTVNENREIRSMRTLVSVAVETGCSPNT